MHLAGTGQDTAWRELFPLPTFGLGLIVQAFDALAGGACVKVVPRAKKATAKAHELARIRAFTEVNTVGITTDLMRRGLVRPVPPPPAVAPAGALEVVHPQVRQSGRQPDRAALLSVTDGQHDGEAAPEPDFRRQPKGAPAGAEFALIDRRRWYQARTTHPSRLTPGVPAGSVRDLIAGDVVLRDGVGRVR